MSEQKPDGIHDAHLLAYNDEAASPDLTQRISESAELRARAASLADIETRLHDSLYRFNCPDSLQLYEYATGLTPDDPGELFASHLQLCPYCATEISQLKEFLAASASDIERDLFTKARVLIGRLLPESGGGYFAAPALAGVRGSSGGPLTYEAEEHQVTLEVQDDLEQPGLRLIVGLLLSPLASGWQAHLTLNNKPVSVAEVDDLGNFLFAGLEPATYDLAMTGIELTIRIQGVAV